MNIYTHTDELISFIKRVTALKYKTQMFSGDMHLPTVYYSGLWFINEDELFLIPVFL